MYDKLTVRLEAAQVCTFMSNVLVYLSFLRQFVIGTDLEASRKALISDEHDQLHLLERININLQVQNSIVPSAHSLARFKVAGHLPSLQVNLSDTKYKSLMKLIDVSIPHFDDDSNVPPRPALPKTKSGAPAFRLRSGLFGTSDQEYHLDDDLDDPDKPNVVQPTPDSGFDKDEFFEAEDSPTEVRKCLACPRIYLNMRVCRHQRCYST